MRKILSALFVGSLAAAAPLAADTVRGVLLANPCAEGVSGYEAAMERAGSCALLEQGKKKGFVLVQEDGQVLRLDAKGNELAAKSLQYGKKTGAAKAEADGSVKGDRLTVKSLKVS